MALNNSLTFKQNTFVQQLMEEVDCSDSSVWTTVMNEIRPLLDNQDSIINPIRMRSHFQQSEQSLSSESQFNEELYMIRYHDYSLYNAIKMKLQKSKTTLVLPIMINDFAAFWSLSEYIEYGNDERFAVINFSEMHTLLLIESQESGKKTKCIISLFMTLFLFFHILKERHHFSLCLSALMHIYPSELSAYFSKTKQSKLTGLLKREFKTCKHYLHGLESPDWDGNVRALSRRLKKDLTTIQKVKQIRSSLFCMSIEKGSSSYGFILRAKITSVQALQSEVGVEFLIQSIRISSSLFVTSLSLRHLSKV